MEVCINRVISAILSIRSWIYTKIEKKCLSIAENNVETAEKYSMKHAVKKNGRNLCKHFPSDAFSGLQHERIYKVEGTWVKFPVWWKGYLNR